jgi:hypothetical protein
VLLLPEAVAVEPVPPETEALDTLEKVNPDRVIVMVETEYDGVNPTVIEVEYPPTVVELGVTVRLPEPLPPPIVTVPDNVCVDVP